MCICNKVEVNYSMKGRALLIQFDDTHKSVKVQLDSDHTQHHHATQQCRSWISYFYTTKARPTKPAAMILLTQAGAV